MGNEEKINILIVDDLPEKLLVFEAILEPLGENIVTASSGREALRYLLDEEFAVILLDVNMPDMDGFETAGMIRSRRQTAHTPIIFVTAFSDDMHTVHGYSVGAVDYILSPVVPEILRTKVGVFVDLFRKTQQVKRQAEERITLAREQAARAVAEEATRRSAFLAEASRVLSRSLDYESIPRDLARHLVPFLGDFCSVMLVDDDTPERLRTELAWRRTGGEGCQHATLLGEPPDDVLAAINRRVFEQGVTESLTNIRLAWPTEGRINGSGPRASTEEQRPPVELKRAVVVPMRARGRMLGTLTFATYTPERTYEATDFALFDDLASRAAIALDNARMYRDIQENDRRKNEFLAMLAHELRNPLAPIRNAVEVLRMVGGEETDLVWAQDVISRQVEQLVRLVDDLLDISRITGGKVQLHREPIDIASVVARAVETSRPLIDDRKHELHISLPTEPIWVDVDAVRIAQVLANLLNNSAKYTEEGGRIELDVDMIDDEVALCVRDNGIGISPEMLLRVFDLFTQADSSLDRSEGGLGIGLTLVRKLVEMHGGTVRAFSEGPNQGSVFIVRLPVLVKTAPVSSGVSERETTLEAPLPRRVLIVDDHPDVGRSLARLLSLRGHHVRVVQDGSSALAAMVDDAPEIVFLDIGLPQMNGFQVAELIRQQPGSEAVILVAVTGYGQEEDRRRSFNAGFNAHLVKPVDPSAVLSLIDSIPSKLSHSGTMS